MPTHHYTHITASPLYTSTHHTIERLSRSSWQITSPLLPAAIPAKTYAEAKQKASEIDFSALSAKAAEPAPVATVDVEVVDSAAVDVEVNPFEAILTEASTITDLGDMQGAYDQAVRECDLCAVFGHLQFRAPTNAARDAVDAARAKTLDCARVTELAGLLVGGALLERITYTAREYVAGIEDDGSSVFLTRLIMALCDLPDGCIKTALIRWACAFDMYEGGWPARLRLEGAALRHAREAMGKGRGAQEVRKVEDGGLADMGGARAREWGEVWDVAMSYDGCERAGLTMHDVGRLRLQYVGMVSDRLPNLLSPEPEHWLPISGDGRVLIVNWRAGECVSEAISAAVWMDDGGLSLMGSYVLGSGWVSDDRLRDEDVDGEALGVILEAIARAGLAAVA